MEFQIIVARYNEDIFWFRHEMDNCIIYNKGEKLNCKNEILLPNVGRESHTYLYHIINNYDNLAEINIFTQGKISDHRNFKEDHINHLMDLRYEAWREGKSKPGDYLHEPGFPQTCIDPDWNYSNGNYFLKDNYLDNQPCLFINWFKGYVLPVYPNPIKWYGNAIFAVKKEFILKRPKSYYEMLIKQVNHHINPTEGHFFERSWYYIFS
jgi:hypothetical protein